MTWRKLVNHTHVPGGSAAYPEGWRTIRNVDYLPILIVSRAETLFLPSTLPP
jgi:hypothetical protein